MTTMTPPRLRGCQTRTHTGEAGIRRTFTYILSRVLPHLVSRVCNTLRECTRARSLHTPHTGGWCTVWRRARRVCRSCARTSFFFSLGFFSPSPSTRQNRILCHLDLDSYGHRHGSDIVVLGYDGMHAYNEIHRGGERK